MIRRVTWLALLALVTAALAQTGHAEDKKPNRDREQIRRLQQNLQKTEQEKSSLQMEKSAVDEQLKASGEKIQGLEKSAQRAAVLSKQLSTLEREKTALTKRLTESENRSAQLDGAQKKSLAENARLQSLLARQGTELAASEAKNIQLYLYSVDLLEKYQSKGLLTSLAQAEPFTGLKRVEIENLLDEYRNKLDAQKVEPVTR